LPNNDEIAADTSSAAAGNTDVVAGAAAALAAPIDDPTPLKSAAIDANTSGTVLTKDDISGSSPHGDHTDQDNEHQKDNNDSGAEPSKT